MDSQVDWSNERAGIGSKVLVDFVGTLSDGSEFDSSRKRGGALELVIGSQLMPPAFERALCNMRSGERKTIELGADRAFGEHLDELVKKVPLANIPTSEKVAPGTSMLVNGPFGMVKVRVLDVEGDAAIIDFNHELAGQDVTYDVTLASIVHTSAIDQELHPSDCSCGCNRLKESLDPRHNHSHCRE